MNIRQTWTTQWDHVQASKQTDLKVENVVYEEESTFLNPIECNPWDL